MSILRKILDEYEELNYHRDKAEDALSKSNDEAYELRMLIWRLAQAIGIKEGEPYHQEDVVEEVLRKLKGE